MIVGGSGQGRGRTAQAFTRLNPGASPQHAAGDGNGRVPRGMDVAGDDSDRNEGSGVGR